MKPRSQIPPAPPLFATLLLPRFPTVSVMSRLVASVESCPSTADVMPLSYDREASCDDGKGAWHAEVQRYWPPVRNCRIQPEPDDRPLTAPHAVSHRRARVPSVSFAFPRVAPTPIQHQDITLCAGGPVARQRRDRRHVERSARSRIRGAFRRRPLDHDFPRQAHRRPEPPL